MEAFSRGEVGEIVLNMRGGEVENGSVKTEGVGGGNLIKKQRASTEPILGGKIPPLEEKKEGYVFLTNERKKRQR